MIRSKNFFEKTNKLFEESGRGDDFKAAGTLNGTLNPQNIAVHLLLDIGDPLSSSSLKMYGIRTQP